MKHTWIWCLFNSVFIVGFIVPTILIVDRGGTNEIKLQKCQENIAQLHGDLQKWNIHFANIPVIEYSGSNTNHLFIDNHKWCVELKPTMDAGYSIWSNYLDVQKLKRREYFASDLNSYLSNDLEYNYLKSIIKSWMAQSIFEYNMVKLDLLSKEIVDKPLTNNDPNELCNRHQCQLQILAEQFKHMITMIDIIKNIHGIGKDTKLPLEESLEELLHRYYKEGRITKEMLNEITTTIEDAEMEIMSQKAGRKSISK